MKVLLCLLALAAGTYAYKSCPNLSAKDSFDYTSFMGTWYKQYYLNTPWELGTCIQSTFTISDYSNTSFTIDSTLKTPLGGTEEVKGRATKDNPNNDEGVFDFILDTYFGLQYLTSSVVATDYDNYAIFYTCSEVWFFRLWPVAPYETIWVFSRDRELTSEVIESIEAAMAVIAEEGGPSFKSLGVSSQTNCDD